MNKHNTLSILKLLLLVVTALTSGCGRSIITDSPTSINLAESQVLQSHTPAPLIPAATTTPMACFSVPSAPKTEIETIAENWFLSEIPQITNRDQYRSVEYLESWTGFCKIYQHEIQIGEDWTKSPTEIALRIVTQNAYLDLFTPNKIILVAENDQNLISKINSPVPPVAYRNIAVVTINYSHYDFHSETRFDFVRENGIWQIRWWGNRQQCINSIDNTKWNTGTLNCP